MQSSSEFIPITIDKSHEDAIEIRDNGSGMETWGKAMARVRGEVNADFLPITSDRTGFIKDSNEYQEFVGIMGKVMEGVKVSLQKLTMKRKAKREDCIRKIVLWLPVILIIILITFASARTNDKLYAGLNNSEKNY